MQNALPPAVGPKPRRPGQGSDPKGDADLDFDGVLPDFDGTLPDFDGEFPGIDGRTPAGGLDGKLPGLDGKLPDFDIDGNPLPEGDDFDFDFDLDDPTGDLAFNVQKPPVITRFSPMSGPSAGNYSLDLFGTGFGTKSNDELYVKFLGTDGKNYGVSKAFEVKTNRASVLTPAAPAKTQVQL